MLEHHALNMTFRTIVENAANKWGDKVGLIFDHTNQRLTFKEIHEKTLEIASVLSSLGIRKQDKVAVMLPNIPEFPLTWLSLGYLGAVMVPMNIHYQTFDAAYVLEHSETNLVVTVADKVDMLDNIRKEHQLTYKIMTVDRVNELADVFLPDLIKTVSKTEITEPVYPETLVNIQYTSGTTGRPKGCMLSQFYWINIGMKTAQKGLISLNESDVLLTAQPYYYIDPQWNTIAAIMNGATLVVLERFRPSIFWGKVREYGVTFFYCLGSMPALLLKMPVSPDDKNHKVKMVGCSAIPPNLHRQLEERWGVKWYEIFGMTETGYDLSMTIEEHDKYVGTGALGRPTFGREARVVDENDRPVERGEVGELVLRGVGLMDGYYKNEEATLEAFRNGWFHTGDLVRMDENGIFYYVGRKKDMIRRGGENISAVEVEEAIMLHESVKLAACVPVKDEIRGEEVKVYVVPSSPVDNKERFIHELIKHCEEKLAAFKIPRYWEIKDSLPLTPSERVAKHLLIKEKPDLRKHSYDRVEGIWHQ